MVILWHESTDAVIQDAYGSKKKKEEAFYGGEGGEGSGT